MTQQTRHPPGLQPPRSSVGWRRRCQALSRSCWQGALAPPHIGPSTEPLTTRQLASPRVRDGERLRGRERKPQTFTTEIWEGTSHIRNDDTFWYLLGENYTNTEYRAHREPWWKLPTTQGMLVLPTVPRHISVMSCDRWNLQTGKLPAQLVKTKFFSIVHHVEWCNSPSTNTARPMRFTSRMAAGRYPHKVYVFKIKRLSTRRWCYGKSKCSGVRQSGDISDNSTAHCLTSGKFLHQHKPQFFSSVQVG